MSNSHVNDRLKEIFETTVDSGIKYEGKLKNLEYYNLFCKAASEEKLYKLMGNNLCMFNCKYEENDAVMMIFFIPINTEESGAKTVAERVMEVVTETEKCFVTIDYLNSEEIKEDKFIYVVIIKNI